MWIHSWDLNSNDIWTIVGHGVAEKGSSKFIL